MNKKNEYNKRFKQLLFHIYALIGYTILSLVLTYPLILKIKRYVPSGGDTWMNLWNMWWFKKALLSPDIFLHFTDYIFYPTGASLVYHDFSYFILSLSLVFQNVFSIILSYNIIFLLGFILSGYAMYLLAHYLTKNRLAAFIAGIIFTFSADHFIHATGHLNLIHMQWVPLYILFLIKTVREKSLKNGVFASVFLILTALTSWYYMMYLFVFTAIFLVYQLKRNFHVIINKAFIKRFILIMFLFSLVMVPIIYPMLTDRSQREYVSKSQSVFFSADLLSFFTPSTLHPIFGRYTKNVYNNFTGSIVDGVNYIGLTVLFLSVWGILKIKRKKFWMLSAIIFFILALGPVLHVNGNILIPFENADLGDFVNQVGIDLPNKEYEMLNNHTPYEALNNNIVIPLPYLLLRYVPFFSVMRSPSRFAILLMLSLAILSAYGLKEIFKKMNKVKIYGNIKKKYIAGILITGFILFESLSVPFPVSKIDVPEIYINMSKDKTNYSILEVPFKIKAMYYQTTHNKKLVYGYISHTLPEAQKFIDDNPLISQLSTEVIMDPDFNLNISKEDLRVLRENNIRYIVIHKNSLDSDNFELITMSLRDVTGKNPKIYEDFGYGSISKNKTDNLVYIYEVV